MLFAALLTSEISRASARLAPDWSGGHKGPTAATDTTTANEVSLFKFKDAEVRVVKIEGEPLFFGTDACDVLMIKGKAYAYGRLGADELRYVGRAHLGLPAGKPMALITESGLYKLVMRSDKPMAKDFQNWVTRVVLPAIRKDGGYIHGEEHVISGAMSELPPAFATLEAFGGLPRI